VTTTIYKYKIPLLDLDERSNYSISMDAFSEILKVGVQRHQEICLWAAVPGSGQVHQQTFKVVGTGHPIDSEDIYDIGSQYIGTVFDGPFVWHVFKV